MKPSERVRLIANIANKLQDEEWSLIDLTLRQFGLLWTEEWGGSKFDYLVQMIQEGSDKALIDLAQHLGIVHDNPDQASLPQTEVKSVIQLIELQKSLMIAVATGGPRIQLKNEEYKSRRIEILSRLRNLGIQDPNPYSDLWSWYGKWSDGSLPNYQSRRDHVTTIYQAILDNLLLLSQRQQGRQMVEPTGWARVDRNIEKIIQALAGAQNEEDFQGVGLLCREAIISLAQAVYDPELHESIDGVQPSETDAKRMLESYIAKELPGRSNEELRKYVKDAYQLAVVLQHRRNANFREAALCAEATRSMVNTIAIISGQRDP